MDNDILQQVQSVNLGTVVTDFPVLAPGVVSATIESVTFEYKENKEGENLPWAVVKLKLAQDWKTQPLEGIPSRHIAAGFVLTDNISLKPWTDPKTQEVKNFGITRLALLRECVFGKAAEGTVFRPEELINQTVTVKLTFDPAPKNKKTGEVYGPQTVVDTYIRRKATS